MLTDLVGRSRSRPSPLIISSVAIVIAMTFTIPLIRQSFAVGKLAVPATWDDVAYFVDAARRLDIVYRIGFTALVRDLMIETPHSPILSLIAIVGFSMFGVHAWAAHLVNGFVLGAFLGAYFIAARQLPIIVTALLATIFVLGHPFSGILVMEFRPDALCGMLTALGTLAIVWRPWAEGDRHTMLLAGALFGGALLTKPTVFPVTLALFGFSMLLAGGPRFLKPASRMHIIGTVLKTIGVAAVIAVPYYVFAWRRLWNYIYTTVSSEAHIWQLTLSLYQHATYYLTGVGGAFASGYWLFAWFAAAIATAFFATRSVRPRLWRTAAVIAACYLIVSVPAQKSPFIGIVLASYFIVTFIMMATVAARHLLMRGQVAFLAVGLMALGCVGLMNMRQHSTQPLFPQAYAKEQQRILSEVLNAIDQSQARNFILQTAVNASINPATISFALWQKGVQPPNMIDLHRSGEPKAYRDKLELADIAIAFDPAADYWKFLPSGGLVETFLSDLRTDPRLKLVRSVKSDSGADVVYVFAKR